MASLMRFGCFHKLAQRATISRPSAVVAANLFSPGANVFLNLFGVRYASKKAAGSAANSGKTAGKRLGVKAFGSSFVKPGAIIVRQKGAKFHPGANVIIGRDYTISAKVAGYVKFSYLRRPFRMKRRVRTFVNVIPVGTDGTDVAKWNEDNRNRYLLTLMIKKKELHYRTVEDLQKMAATQILKDQGKVPKLEGDWKDLIRKPENQGKGKEHFIAQGNIYARQKVFRPRSQKVIGILDTQQRKAGPQ
mmetsp:Transcript_35203/g.69092  ORF Transcript_35203/g.69092 Transcript_35203/m.69092 type:complete len:247 (+) Transcript_35203:32-772(+)|eukprot:CAMPEP_0175088560 /NCGR_PEP_ID=MMETSP0086_2-20121207/312_1 /TAXON_ID=136419 /ORGANISM="Unknown Unknown, Strain D1" /LENGTH=246 /DNA_ID=CAMNT_0016360999 /DNA_START=31 /DNA_END=771 /DNA_ORIENTATION=+